MEKSKAAWKIDLKGKAQILDQLPAPVMVVDKDFHITYLNQQGLELAGAGMEETVGKLCHSIFHTTDCKTDNCCMRKALETGKMHSGRTETVLHDETHTMEYYAVPLTDDHDEIVGGVEFIVDITKQAQYEKNLIEQSKTIQKLSTPIIKLWNGILVLPIIGVIDSMRAQTMMENMLTRIAETYSRVIILDIHGVAAMDTAVAQHLIKIAKATKLMGCDCILSGISPAVAQTIIHLGIDMEAIKTRATLSDAFAEALELLDKEVTSKGSE